MITLAYHPLFPDLIPNASVAAYYNNFTTTPFLKQLILSLKTEKTITVKNATLAVALNKAWRNSGFPESGAAL